jgi:hypothetical protein
MLSPSTCITPTCSVDSVIVVSLIYIFLLAEVPHANTVPTIGVASKVLWSSPAE